MFNAAFTFGAGSSSNPSGRVPFPLTLLAILVFTMAVTTVYDALRTPPPEIGPIFFKCTSCGAVVQYTMDELKKMQQPGQMAPMMGPMVLDCPKCKKHTLTQAVACPKCQEVFVMQMDPSRNLFNDKCPKCGESYAKAWQEKYRKENGE